MSSTVNYPPYTSIVRHMVKIPSNLNSIILGLVLSDAWLFKNKAGNTFLAFKQSIDKSTFVLYVFNKLSNYCSRYPAITSSTLKGKKFKGIVMTTRVYPCFTEWHSIFYVNNKKIVPLDLYNLLTYEVLAYWIMGNCTREKKGLILQKQSFTLKEVVFIIGVLIHKFDLKCSIYMQRNQATIYIHTASMKNLIPKIIPYFLNPCCTN